MAKLTYMAFTSLDGYIEDEGGGFDWAVPDPEVHTFVNNLERPAGTYLYGRRISETMVIWQTVGIEPTDTSTAESAPPTEELDSPRCGGRPTRSSSPAGSTPCGRPDT